MSPDEIKAFASAWGPMLGAFASITAASLAAYVAWQNRIGGERFAEKMSDRNAKLSYRYDAKKRLYAECEPL
ncbi:MAG TPA: hypothetical protein VK669_01185, partial [Candidatus Limnocylindrales bacterium]|nr:hypothetical protein [Candidatus Limnocylindrales bacterium]